MYRQMNGILVDIECENGNGHFLINCKNNNLNKAVCTRCGVVFMRTNEKVNGQAVFRKKRRINHQKCPLVHEKANA